MARIGRQTLARSLHLTWNCPIRAQAWVLVGLGPDDDQPEFRHEPVFLSSVLAEKKMSNDWIVWHVDLGRFGRRLLSTLLSKLGF